MKLSKKGLQRLSHKTTHPSTDGTYRCRPIGHEQVYALESFEFHSDDFVDCVVLTLDEAKEISFQLYSLAMLYDTLILELDPDKELIRRVGKSYEPLNKKISQARKVMRIEQAEEQ